MSDHMYLSIADIREMDRLAIEDYGMPGIILMENAGLGVVRGVLDKIISDEVLVLCGKGNNGGDGFVIARHLYNRGIKVKVMLAEPADKIGGDALINFNIIEKMHIPVVQYEANLDKAILHSEFIIDALLGSGLNSAVRGPYDAMIQAINRSKAYTVAVDIPSGLNADSGKPLNIAVQANRTYTFGAYKLGFRKTGAGQWTGEYELVDIGLPVDVLARFSDINTI